MNYNEIFLTDIEENKAKIIKDIQGIGINLSRSSRIIKRRDLVDLINERNNFKIKDSLIIDTLVKEAYEKSSYSENLSNALVNCIESNNTNNKVFNPNRVYIEPSCWVFDKDKILADIDLVTKTQEDVLKTDGIGLINKIADEVEKITVTKQISITGGFKVEAYSEYATNIVNGYEKIINTYENVKNKNLDLISDFEDVRNELKIIREDILNLLIDLFGNSIKSDEPELFDFSNISWIDFESTWDKLNLFYDDINKNIETFRMFHTIQLDNIFNSSKQNINTFFNKSNNIIKNNGNSEDLKAAAISAGVNFLFETGSTIIKTRSEAKKTVATIKRDVEKLKLGMKGDIELLLNDIIRLAYLQTEIKDKLLPQIKLFISKIYKRIDTNVLPIYNKIISNKNIENLRNSNIKLTIESRKIEQSFLDEKNKMELSKNILLNLDNYISNNTYEYQYIKNLHPKKPKGIYKFLYSKKIFNETLNEWNKYCKPKAEEYEVMVKNHQNEINLQNEITTNIKLLKNRKTEIEQILISNSTKINELFKTNPINNDLLKDLIINIKEIVTSSKGVLEVSLKDQLLTN